MWGRATSKSEPEDVSRQGGHEEVYPWVRRWQRRALRSALRQLGFLVAFLLSVEISSAAAPINDRFQLAQVLRGVVGSVQGSTLEASFQSGEPLPSGRASMKTIWYRWRPPFPLTVTFSTQGSDPDTLLAVYTGSGLNALTLQAFSDDDSPGSRFARVSFSAKVEVEYWISVDGAGGESGATALGWTSTPHNDVFQKFQLLPASSGSYLGSSLAAQLQAGELPPVVADAGATVWFAWPALYAGEVSFDTVGSAFDTVLAVYMGDDIHGLTPVIEDDDSGSEPGSSLVTWQAEAGARYRIVLGGRGGASGDYHLNWHQNTPPPDHDDLAAARRISGATGESFGSNEGATIEPEEPGVAGALSSVWFYWRAPRSGTVFFDAELSFIAPHLRAFTGDSYETLGLLAVGVPGPFGGGDRLQFAVEEGMEIRVALASRGLSEGSYTLRWNYLDLRTENNQFANAQRLVGFNGVCSGENFWADRESGEPLHAEDPGGRSVWYRWVAPGNFRVRWSTQGSNFDTLLAVYVGEGLQQGLQSIASNDDFDRRLSSQVDFVAEAGIAYFIAVDSSSDRGFKAPSIGSISLKWAPVALSGLLVHPFKGMVGTRICIGAQELDGVESVRVGGVDAPFYVQDGGLYAVVPAGAATGPISVNTQDGDSLSTRADFTILPGVPPHLTILYLPNGAIRLAWAATCPDFRVEWASGLLGPAGWDMAQDPVQTGDQYRIEIPRADLAARRFFRLVIP